MTDRNTTKEVISVDCAKDKNQFDFSKYNAFLATVGTLLIILCISI